MFKKLFSFINGLVSRKTGIPGTAVSEPGPSVPMESQPADVSPGIPEEPPPGRVKKKAPSPPVKRKKVKTPSKSKPRFDNKGFRIISDGDDLEKLFRVGGVQHKEREESFARLFEKSRIDAYQQAMLKEKMYAPGVENKKPLTAAEKIKLYPRVPQAELDLHGYTGPEAEVRAETFIRNARVRGLKTVRIIVGKGLHSDGKAVLPDVVQTKMIDLKRKKWVLGYKWENKDKRKSGSLIVYLVPY
jgi:DNA-nicking Smr family endonuclease